ncbi:squalene/phytoene synthase family protein [Thiosocius teredinicola]|uniref:squalene/phytoene synthase family protein n=1 Tax=Thiosocius teredinicola TaxID=1973002 RepID=UPI00099136C7
MRTAPSDDIDEWSFPNRATPVGSAAYYAVRFSAPQERDHQAQLLAWHQTIRDICDHPNDPGVARLKLDWWHTELKELAAGRARHPLAFALQRSIEPATVSIMQDIVDAAEQRIRQPQPANDKAFIENCRGDGGKLFLLLTQNRAGVGKRRQIIDHGAYCAAIESIRQFARYPDRLPPDMTLNALRDWSTHQRRVRIGELLQHLQLDRDVTATLAGVARRLFALSSAIDRKMQRTGYAVADRPVERSPLAHLWTAWRCH